MQNVQTSPDDVKVAEGILSRMTEPFGDDAYIRAANLLTFVRTITWRNGITSPDGALRVWRMLEGKQIDMEWMIEMVNEYVYRMGLTTLQNEVATRQAESLAWVSLTVGIPKEVKQFADDNEKIREGLSKSPLLMFLFSLSMCNYQQRLADVGIAKLLAGQKPRRDKAAAAAPAQVIPNG